MTSGEKSISYGESITSNFDLTPVNLITEQPNASMSDFMSSGTPHQVGHTTSFEFDVLTQMANIPVGDTPRFWVHQVNSMDDLDSITPKTTVDTSGGTYYSEDGIFIIDPKTVISDIEIMFMVKSYMGDINNNQYTVDSGFAYFRIANKDFSTGLSSEKTISTSSSFSTNITVGGQQVSNPNITAIPNPTATDVGALAVQKNVPKNVNLHAVFQNYTGWTITESPTNGTLTPDPAYPNSPFYIYTPNTDYTNDVATMDSIKYTCTDGVITSDEKIALFFVTNDVPVLPDVTPPSGTEDTPYDITSYIFSGSDANGDTLTYTLVSEPSMGVVQDNNGIRTAGQSLSGTVYYIPNDNEFNLPNTFDTFTWKCNDGTVDSPVADFKMHTQPVNDLPVAATIGSESNRQESNEDNGMTITLSATDIEEQACTFQITEEPVNGKLLNIYWTDYNSGHEYELNDPVPDSSHPANNGNVVTVTHSGTTTTVPIFYMPSPNFHGTDQFKYRAHDGTNYGLEKTVYLKVNDVNDKPVAHNDTIGTNEISEGGSIAITLPASDVENNTLTYTITNNPTYGTLDTTSLNNGLVTYSHNGTNNDYDSFTFKVNDGQWDSENDGTIAINIAMVDDNPVAGGSNPSPLSVDEKGQINFDLIGSDEETNTSIGYYITTMPSNGYLQEQGSSTLLSSATPVPHLLSTNQLTYSAPDQGGFMDSFNYKVRSPHDNTGKYSDAVTIQITVNAVDDSPVWYGLDTPSDHTITLVEDISDTFDIPAASDPDNDDAHITYTVKSTSNLSHGTIEKEPASGPRTFRWNPTTANFHGSAGSVEFTATSNNKTVDSAAVPVTISSVNDSPVATAGTHTTQEDTAITVSLTATDADGDALTYYIVHAVHHNYGQLTKPNGTALADGDAVGSAGENQVVFTPVQNWHGSDQAQFDWRAHDGTTFGNTVIERIDVTPVNDPPTYDDWTFSAAESNTDATDVFHIELAGETRSNWSDPDDTSHWWVITEIGKGYFTRDKDDGTTETITTSALPYTLWSGGYSSSYHEIYWTPDEANWNGSTYIKYKMYDGEVLGEEKTITINIAATNDPPIASWQNLSTDEDTDLVIDFSQYVSDVDDAITHWDIVNTTNLEGSLSHTGNNPINTTVTYTPTANWYGNKEDNYFIYRVKDESGAWSADATIYIDVNAVDDSPVAYNLQINNVTEDTAKSFDITGNAYSEYDGDSVTISFPDANTSNGGTVSASGSSWTYTPPSHFNGNDYIDYRVADNNNPTTKYDEAQITFQVIPVDDPPVASMSGYDGESTSNPIELTEDQNVTIQLRASQRYNESDTLYYHQISSPAHGSLSSWNTSTGTVVYTPALHSLTQDAVQQDSFKYQVFDGGTNGLASGQETVYLKITGVDDALSWNNATSPYPVSTNEDTDKTFSYPATDVDGTVTYEVTQQPNTVSNYTGDQRATLSNNGSSFTINQLTANWYGTLYAQIKANSTNSASVTRDLQIVISSVNDPVLWGSSTVARSCDEDSLVQWDDVATDADGGGIEYSIITQPQYGSITQPDGITDPTFQFSPSTANWSGNAGTGKIRATSPTGYVEKEITFTVNAVDDAPDAGSALSYTVAEDGSAVTGTFSATDVDTDASDLRYTFRVNGEDETTVNTTLGTYTLTHATNGTWSYTPDANDNGTDDIVTWGVRDDSGNGTLDTSTIQFTVTAVADHPTHSADVSSFSSWMDYNGNAVSSTSEGSAYFVNLNNYVDWVDGGDPEIVIYNYSKCGVAATNGAGAHTGITHQVTMSSSYTSNQTAWLEFYARNPNNHNYLSRRQETNWDVCRLTWVFNANDDSASWSNYVSGTKTVAEDSGTTSWWSISTYDPDSSNPTPSASVISGSGSATVSGGQVKYTTSSNWSGTATIRQSATGLPNRDFNVTVSPVNDAPSISGTYSFGNRYRGEEFTLTLAGSDVDGDSLTFNTGTGSNNTASISGTTLSITAGNTVGSMNRNITVTDGTATSSAYNITGTVVNRSPSTGGGKSITTVVDNQGSVTLSGSDPDGDTLTYSLVNNQSVYGDTPSLTGSTVTWTPTSVGGANTLVHYKVTDSQNASSGTSAITLTSTAPPNTAPVAQNVTGTIKDGSGTLYGVATDTDGDSLTYSKVSGTGTVASNGYITFSGLSGDGTTATCTYKANDGTVDSNHATATATNRLSPTIAKTGIWVAVPYTHGGTTYFNTSVTFNMGVSAGSGTITSESISNVSLCNVGPVSNGVVSVSHAAGGTGSFTYSVTNSYGYTTSRSMSVNKYSLQNIVNHFGCAVGAPNTASPACPGLSQNLTTSEIWGLVCNPVANFAGGNSIDIYDLVAGGNLQHGRHIPS